MPYDDLNEQRRVPSRLRAFLHVFNAGFVSSHAHTGEEFMTSIKDNNTNIGTISAFLASIAYSQLSSVANAKESFGFTGDEEATFAYKLYVFLGSVGMTFLFMATVMSVILLIILSNLTPSKFEQWYAMTTIVNRLPYVFFLFGLCFLIGTFVLEAVHEFGMEIGLTQVVIYTGCAAILFGAMTHAVYSLELVEATGPSQHSGSMSERASLLTENEASQVMRTKPKERNCGVTRSCS